MRKDDETLNSQADTSALRSRFAITPLLDTEIDVGAAGWVGLTPEADHDLRVDVTSAVIARVLGSSPATAKKYMRGVKEHHPRDGLIRKLCASHMNHYDVFYRTIPIRRDAPLGVFAFDLAMIRSRASIELMLITARQGFLIEPCLIARSVLEQFAYASHVWLTDDDDTVFLSKPQSLIRYLNQVNPHAGRAYGLLSRLAHYDPKLHYSFIGDMEENGNEESSTVLQRSWRFKVASLAWVFFILDMKFKIFRRFYGNNETFRCLKPISEPVRVSFEKFFDGVDLPAVQQVRLLL